jgi:hypothetical protein
MDPAPTARPPLSFQLALVFSALFLTAVLFYSFGRLAPEGEAEATTPAKETTAIAGTWDTELLPLDLTTDGPPHPDHPVPTTEYQPTEGPAYELIHLLDQTAVPLYDSPGGEVIETLGPRTEFGSGIVVPVIKRRGDWLAIQSGLLDNGYLGWMQYDPRTMERLWTKYSLHIDISDRNLQLRYGTERLGDFTVTVGAAGSDTPLGRFAVSDALTFSDSPWYGCCALALNAHQTALPVGWIGGDRVAIHGTEGGVGLAESHGCIRATNDTMETLFKRVPIGTPVFIST